MKNLLVYVNPSKNFSPENEVLVKIQIDNSLSLGWKKKDILLATNFDYQYQGVKAFRVADTNYCPFRPLSTKTITAAYLLQNKLLDKDELYWIHDLDAYQLSTITKEKLRLGNNDLGLTTYGWSDKWCLGSYFFKPSSEDILHLIKQTIYDRQTEDERALVFLTKRNINGINKRIKKLDISYQIGMRYIGQNYNKAKKPLKVIHFHPWIRGREVLDSFMYGKNEIGSPLMSKELIKIFNKHGVK